MATFRKMALCEASTHKEARYYRENGPVSSYFGVNVFDLEKMRRYMSQSAFDAVQAAVRKAGRLTARTPTRSPRR